MNLNYITKDGYTYWINDKQLEFRYDPKKDEVKVMASNGEYISVEETLLNDIDKTIIHYVSAQEDLRELKLLRLRLEKAVS